MNFESENGIEKETVIGKGKNVREKRNRNVEIEKGNEIEVLSVKKRGRKNGNESTSGRETENESVIGKSRSGLKMTLNVIGKASIFLL